MRSSNSLECTHEAVLNELLTEISELAHIRTGRLEESTDTSKITSSFKATESIQKHRMITRSKSRNTKVYTTLFAQKEVFNKSRMEEIDSLRDLGCFKVFSISEAEGHRLYRSTFIDTIKPSGEKRSRLCVPACNDQQHGLFTSLRLLIALTAIMKLKLYTRDVRKAFVMSKTPLRRPVYLKPPSEMKLPKAEVLKVIKPL